MDRKILLEFLLDKGWNVDLIWWVDFLAVSIVLIIVAVGLDLMAKGLVKGLFKRLARRTKTHLDDYLLEARFPTYVAQLFPYFFLNAVLPIWVIDRIGVSDVLNTILNAYGVLITVWILRSLLHAIRSYLRTLESFKDKPIDSYIQVFMIVIWVVGIVVLFSIITGREIGYFLTAMGALSAVLLLIFKDTILGFVASIQIAANDLVRIGDWVTMEKYGADGDVIEINLSTVKVQNFDKTITTIPTYNLISDSFKNWRGMAESGGRRIKRSMLIQTQSIRFLKDEELTDLQRIERVASYLKERKEEIEKANQDVDKSLAINGRNLTNLGLYRKYIENYLEHHPKISNELTIMCRQLPTTSYGSTPLEIYAFSSDKVWKNYEHITADIFDHLLAAVSYFDLRCFEVSQGFIKDN
ncbi:MAG: mechanosensitive ion channel [Flavobacteriaceae bacterium]|nr:mechanosensitive ion channel [Flavobacteriaceae bacterium]